MSIHIEDPDTISPLSALEAIGKISRTASEFTRRGIQGIGQRIVRTPLVPEHEASLREQVATSSARKAPYKPYVHFKPREATPQPTDDHNEGRAGRTPNSGVIPYKPYTRLNPRKAVCQVPPSFSNDGNVGRIPNNASSPPTHPQSSSISFSESDEVSAGQTSDDMRPTDQVVSPASSRSSPTPLGRSDENPVRRIANSATPSHATSNETTSSSGGNNDQVSPAPTSDSTNESPLVRDKIVPFSATSRCLPESSVQSSSPPPSNGNEIPVGQTSNNVPSLQAVAPATAAYLGSLALSLFRGRTREIREADDSRSHSSRSRSPMENRRRRPSGQSVRRRSRSPINRRDPESRESVNFPVNHPIHDSSQTDTQLPSSRYTSPLPWLNGDDLSHAPLISHRSTPRPESPSVLSPGAGDSVAESSSVTYGVTAHPLEPSMDTDPNPSKIVDPLPMVSIVGPLEGQTNIDSTAHEAHHSVSTAYSTQGPMEIDYVHPSSPTVPPSPSTRGPMSTSSDDRTAPTRPSLLPAALGTVIDHAIAERFGATAAELVEPTARGIVDACMPRVMEFMQSYVATLAPVPSTESATRKNSPPSPEAETDSDIDDGVGFVVSRRRKPGPRGKANRLHTAFRLYLRQKNVISSGPKGVLPCSAPVDAVHAFNADGVSPPSLENIMLDWYCSPLTSSQWNREVICLLSLDFYNNLKSGQYQSVSFDEATMNLSVIRKMCEQKLIRTYRAHKVQARLCNIVEDEQAQAKAHEAAKVERRRKGDRMNARRHGTFARRKKIVSQNRDRDPDKWSAIHDVIERLGVEGMSGDETDHAPTVYHSKVLRRLELPWISPAISTLVKSVETFEPAYRLENMVERVGNPSLKRHWEPGRKEVRLTPVQGLPRNWYNDGWFRGLSPGARLMLCARKDIAIPTLEPYPSR